jgi:putative nucleotidyltransferase with HDIG domain
MGFGGSDMLSTATRAVGTVEAIVRERLAGWPSGWEGYHWPGYTWEHSLRVRALALTLARRESADLVVVELAGLLHDICKQEGHGHAQAGADEAERVLCDLGIESAMRGRVCAAIAAHAGPGDGPSVVENVCLSDADLMDANLGLVGVWRFVTIRSGHGMDLDQTLGSLREWLPGKNAVLGALVTRSGREIARCRAARMRVFCEEVAHCAVTSGTVTTLPGLLDAVRFIHADGGRRLLKEQLEEWEELAGEMGAEADFSVLCRSLRAEIEGEH